MASEAEQVKIRLSAEEAEALDAVRGASSRAAYVKAALSSAVEGPGEQPMREPDLPPAPPKGPSGGRLALVCTECNRRQFGNPEWRCPEHPKKTAVQKNRPYFGQAVPTPEVKGLPVVENTIR